MCHTTRGEVCVRVSVYSLIVRGKESTAVTEKPAYFLLLITVTNAKVDQGVQGINLGCTAYESAGSECLTRHDPQRFRNVI